MTAIDPAAIWRKRPAVWRGDVTAPEQGCLAAMPERSALVVPLRSVPGTPVTEWRIGTDADDSGVTLGQLEEAMARRGAPRSPLNPQARNTTWGRPAARAAGPGR